MFREHRLPCVVLAAVIAAVMGRATARAQVVDAEHRLKAAFVSKFPQFTEWPTASLGARQSIELCVAQPNPFGSVLGDLVAGERLGARPFVIREVVVEQTLDSCQLLYVPNLSSDDRRALLAKVGDLPVLTIGESPEFLDEGGMIVLRMIEGGIRFEVDVTAAERAGLRLSSQLLQLAVRVRGGRS